MVSHEAAGTAPDVDAPSLAWTVTESRPRRLPRVLLLLVAALLVMAAVYSGRQMRARNENAGRHNHAFARIRPPYQAVVRGEGQGDPALLATRSAADLERWAAAQPPGQDADGVGGDSPARVHLYLSGRVLLVPAGVTTRVLQEQGSWCRIQVLSGPHQGAVGFMDRQALIRPSATVR